MSALGFPVKSLLGVGEWESGVPLIVEDGFLDLVGLKAGERLGAGKELPQQDAVAAVRPCRCCTR
jgi:hypothetical protein